MNLRIAITIVVLCGGGENKCITESDPSDESYTIPLAHEQRLRHRDRETAGGWEVVSRHVQEWEEIGHHWPCGGGVAGDVS